MDLLIAVRIAPGEGGMAERHSWTLKEVKTVAQCLEFVRTAVRPFVGSQQDLSEVVVDRSCGDDVVRGEDEMAAPSSVPATAPKRRRKKARAEADNDEDMLPWHEVVGGEEA